MAKAIAKRFVSTRCEGAKGTHTEESSIETIFGRYLGFALHVMKANVVYCSQEAIKRLPSTSEARRCRRMRSGKVKELGVTQVDGTFFAPCIPF